MPEADDRQSKLLAKFRRITADRLSKLLQGLDALQDNPGNEILAKDLMREIHTVKGEAKIMKFSSANAVAHRIEDIMIAALKTASLESVREQITVGLDLIAELVESPDPDDEMLVASVEEFLAFTEETDSTPPDPESEKNQTAKPSREQADAPEVGKPPIDLHASEQKPASAEQNEPSEETKPDPTNKGRDQSQDYIGVSGNELTALTNLAGDLKVNNEQIDRLFSDIARMTASIQAEVERASHILNKEGRNVFEGLRRQDPLIKLAAFGRELSSTLSRGRDDLFENDLRLGVLQDQIRRMRMVRIGELFERHSRGIREIAREQGKKIRIKLEGEDVVMDKQVLDQLDALLLHLTRNAVDHGLERPEKRRVADKSEYGEIALTAREFGSQVEVTVRDDGVGIDPDTIRRTAVERRVISSEEAASMPDSAIFGLLFEAGFSTREKASDLSGRGVGLDVVASQLTEVGGSVRVESELGMGTRFILSTPISVAFSKILVFKIDNELYALPSIAIEKALRVSGSELDKAGEGYSLLHEGQQLPVVLMRELLGLPGRVDFQNGKLNIIVLHAGRNFALLVDDIIGQREVVRKNLDRFSSGNNLISGTAVLEGRRLVLFLNLPELARRMTGARTGSSTTLTAEDEQATTRGRSKRRLLVVDDSELTRDMLVSLLERLGYDVDEAVDGVDALEVIERARPDLVLTDLDMPIMDGFKLTERLKENPETQEIPVIVISTRGSDADKKRAAEAGADGYIVKSSFRADEFNRTLSLYLNSER